MKIEKVMSERKGEGGGRYEEREERWKQIKKGVSSKKYLMTASNC